MKIISGEWGGRTLTPPSGSVTRPTGARAREALFSMLTSVIGSFEGLQVADLFAGTGALGLEALSRGASKCVFVDNGRDALSALRENIEQLAAAERTRILSRTIPDLGPSPFGIDLALLDAPYGKGLTGPALTALRENGWLKPMAFVSVEIGAREALGAPGYVVVRDRTYGKARILLLRFEG